MAENLYCKILDEETGLVQVGAGCPDEYYIEIGMEKRNVEISEKDNNWYLEEKCPHYTPEEIEERERIRIGNLKATKRIFMFGLQQFGVTYSQLKELIATNEQAQMEWDLCMELERKNPLLDIMAAQFGITHEMLDYIFRKANGEDVPIPEMEQ